LLCNLEHFAKTYLVPIKRISEENVVLASY
jgi:hypothetical protein